MAEQLEGPSYRVTTAAHGREALDQLKAHPTQWNILITDHVMPKMTGIQLIEEILKQPTLLQSLKAIVLFSDGFCGPYEPELENFLKNVPKDLPFRLFSKPYSYGPLIEYLNSSLL